MFNFSKDNVENTTDRLAKKSDEAIEEIAAQVKSTANDLLDAVNDTADNTQDKAKELIHSLKANIDRLTSEENAAALASKASRVKDQVQREVSETYQSLKGKTVDTVHEHPMGTVLVAAGVGLLIGYLLGSKRRE
ncbi:MAG: hypothetical protein E6Q51_00045 [Methylophilus methylotrophus]|uniref:DUF883 domain-containing protein n=1 Tax=Methylophilus methylotrophus TaxID=17 RepID=A0A5C7WQX8_METME|nr:hypothetical protein [Methylophilus methylotrophus]TXI39008.1 MAG: hypothetical protein E6Q51_00045 [Methylophilus methylotrophus]